jgi:hypothetical protein
MTTGSADYSGLCCIHSRRIESTSSIKDAEGGAGLEKAGDGAYCSRAWGLND